MELEHVTERLLRAACGGDLAAARDIVERHPAVTRESFHAACAAADAGAVEAWLARDPSIVSQPHREHGWPPILVLCASRMHAIDAPRAEASLRCAQLLLDAGADPNAHVLSDPANPDARLPALYYACVANNVPVVSLLLERGAHVNDGESVYHAAQLNHRECLERLLAHRAEISAPHPFWKNTPLYFLAGDGSGPALEGMRWLLEHGANPDEPSGERQETPLHAAVIHGHASQVGLLLEHGADPNRRRADGRTAWTLSVRGGSTEIAGALVAAGAQRERLNPIDELLAACMAGDESAARRGVTSTPGILATLTPEDRATIATAIRDGRDDAVRTMVAIGLDLGWQPPHGGTPLHWAAWHGRTPMVRLLLELGAAVNIRDSTYGSSPIAWTAHGSTHCRGAGDEAYCAIADLLIDAGATYDVSINNWNEPPQDMASPGVRARLVERGFVPAARTATKDAV